MENITGYRRQDKFDFEYDWKLLGYLREAKTQKFPEIESMSELPYDELERTYERCMNNSRLFFEQYYANFLVETLNYGIDSENRTGVDTIRKSGFNIELHTHFAFPILRGKSMGFKTAFIEFMWIMLGKTDINFLHKYGVKYWDLWVNEETKNFGRIYGEQLRKFTGRDGKVFDQLLYVINELRTNPDSRRAIINLWQPNDLSEMSLPPCHFSYQFTTMEFQGQRYIDMFWHQRSADAFLGVPYDFILAGLFIHFIAIFTGYKPRTIYFYGNDFHIYNNAIPSVEKYIDNLYEDPRKLFIVSDRNQLPQIQYNDELINQFSFLKGDGLSRNITQQELDSFLLAIVENNFNLFKLYNYDDNQHYDKISCIPIK